jgi:hypothetical protein
MCRRFVYYFDDAVGETNFGRSSHKEKAVNSDTDHEIQKKRAADTSINKTEEVILRANGFPLLSTAKTISFYLFQKRIHYENKAIQLIFMFGAVCKSRTRTQGDASSR